MPQIVQFTHPGKEHGSDKNNSAYKSWNKESHRRKFICANGEYIINDRKEHGEIMFWGEWEPPSHISSLETPNNNNLLPKWLHKPYLPFELPVKSDGDFQNTDPFVFGDSFKYFCCKQDKQSQATKCAKLDKGSLILFGSTNGRTKENAFFKLDTVFVVSDFIEYDASSNLNTEHSLNVNKDYYNAVFKMRFPTPTEYSLKFRLYFGATYDKPFNGMYSFSPAKIYNGDLVGFPRVQLKNLNPQYLTNNLNAAPKISCGIDIGEIKRFWQNIRETSREQGCIEGVKFEYNKE